MPVYYGKYSVPSGQEHRNVLCNGLAMDANSEDIKEFDRYYSSGLPTLLSNTRIVGELLNMMGISNSRFSQISKRTGNIRFIPSDNQENARKTGKPTINLPATHPTVSGRTIDGYTIIEISYKGITFHLDDNLKWLCIDDTINNRITNKIMMPLLPDTVINGILANMPYANNTKSARDIPLAEFPLLSDYVDIPRISHLDHRILGAKNKPAKNHASLTAVAPD